MPDTRSKTIMRRYSLCHTALLLCLLPSTTFARRSVLALSTWAQENGVAMHPSISWKDNGDGDWGLQLTSKVNRGTVLISVPRSLVLDSAVIKNELLLTSNSNNHRDNDNNEEIVSKCINALGTFQVHEENFWIVIKLYQCLRDKDPKYAPWLDAMPKSFSHFTDEEQECLPYYAKYIAVYQKQKLEKFCEAASILLFDDDDDGDDEEKITLFSKDDTEKLDQLIWAFNAVGSRFWKTESTMMENYQPRSELVPLGDMFNHRDPPNVKIVHDYEKDAVCFMYLGDDEEANGEEEGEEVNCYPKDLFITYGQPYNPHRFLMIFGFVPTDMKEVWSHLTTLSETNPYSGDVSKMIFQCQDGTIPQQIWDAILYELDPEQSIEELRLSPTARGIAADVLENHVTKELSELVVLKDKIDSTQGENMGLIRQHNAFLTNVFHRVQDNIAKMKDEMGKGG